MIRAILVAVGLAAVGAAAAAADQAPPAIPKSFFSLITGDSLSGWTVEHRSPDSVSAADGVMTVTEQAASAASSASGRVRRRSAATRRRALKRQGRGTTGEDAYHHRAGSTSSLRASIFPAKSRQSRSASIQEIHVIRSAVFG